MIYIRTKDGVYELKENMTIENGVYSFFGKIYDTTEKHLFRNDKDLGEFVSQSENLEELCDEFVIALKDSKKNPNDNIYDKEEYYSIFQRIGYAKDYYNEDYNDLYGAIWTDKGLIYVAKMNDKGELVLIWQ